MTTEPTFKDKYAWWIAKRGGEEMFPHLAEVEAEYAAAHPPPPDPTPVLKEWMIVATKGVAAIDNLSAHGWERIARHAAALEAKRREETK